MDIHSHSLQLVKPYSTYKTAYRKLGFRLPIYLETRLYAQANPTPDI